MKNKGIIAVFTLLAFILSVSTIWLVTNNKAPQSSSVLGTATEADLKVESSIDYIKSNADGSSEIKYVYTFSNISTLYNIVSIRAQTSLQATFAPHVFQILSLTSDGFSINPSFNGAGNTELLTDGTLNLGEVKHVYLVVKFYPEGSTGPFQNRITSTGDIVLPSTGSTNGGSGGGNTGGGNTTSTPPSTSTTTTTTTTGGSTGTTGGSGTGGVTSGEEPTPIPVSQPTTTTSSGGSMTGGTGTGTGGSTSGGTNGGTTGATTGGGDPDTVAAAQVSFTLTASGGGGDIIQEQLPGTSASAFHLGLISNITEWIKDNFTHPQRNKIQIEKVGINGEVFNGNNETTLNQGFWRLPESSTPGNSGNTIIAGHRFTYNYGPYTFYNLDKLAIGDEIKLNWEGKNYTYKINKVRIVDAKDISVLDQTDKSILTLITCTTWDINEPRLVIEAELK